ncbi:MAG: ATP-binding protein [Cyanobacteriota bacterium]|nr:ATP-binding protein [Cyanobacteriota bacterium]
MNSNAIITAENVDLTNCDREAIHIPGSIQPHGVLLALEESELKICQVSTNTLNVLGLSPETLLGTTLHRWLEERHIDALNSHLRRDFETVNPLKLTFNSSPQTFDAIAHRNDNLLLLELEPTSIAETADFFTFYQWVKSPIQQMQQTSTLREIGEVVVREIRKITGFDRIMIYRFNEDGVGRVIAENKREDLESFLNLHYPETDIPKQARKLYFLNWLRLIPDIAYQPSSLVPQLNPITGEPLDLSQAVLRSVSPIHVEYLRNMGVTASMSISLLDGEKLWGLVACHHDSPKFIPCEIRTVCEFLGQVMSLEIATKEKGDDREYTIRIGSVQSQLIAAISQSNDWISSLNNNSVNLLQLVGASGVALLSGETLTCIGQTPGSSEIRELIPWLETQLSDEPIYHTHSLAKVYPPAEAYGATASGLLALSISQSQQLYILAFRPEVLQIVNWGGNPNKPVEVASNGKTYLSPRKSFALWQETVLFQSLPWKLCEIEAALELRNAIVGIVLRQVDELARVNRELERSNQELDAFAYIASHDLKEPLRGIHNYSNFLLEDYGEILDEEGASKLQTLVRLTQRMEDLIESLLHFSRLGRIELSLKSVDLNDLLHHYVLDILRARVQESQTEIRIPRPLPMALCDRVQTSELLTNLIGNAMKYNNKSQKWVEIGYLDPDEAQSKANYVFYVKDNGIGIRDRHFDSVFRIFKRLHARDRYGGGTGVGLTISKKIAERHGGDLWLESKYGEGTTFYFTLAPST